MQILNLHRNIIFAIQTSLWAVDSLLALKIYVTEKKKIYNKSHNRQKDVQTLRMSQKKNTINFMSKLTSTLLRNRLRIDECGDATENHK